MKTFALHLLWCHKFGQVDRAIAKNVEELVIGGYIEFFLLISQVCCVVFIWFSLSRLNSEGLKV